MHRSKGSTWLHILFDHVMCALLEATSVNALDHFHPTLENFEDMINWSLSQPMSDANAHDVIEPAISIR